MKNLFESPDSDLQTFKKNIGLSKALEGTRVFREATPATTKTQETAFFI